MDFPKYDGNVNPNEWINDIQKYLRLKNISNKYNEHLEIAILLIDSSISLPPGIDSFGKLRKALREDISFTIFKNTNKRKLQSLKYIPESSSGDTSKFISTFRKLCYNAEINDIEEQKKYLNKSLPMNEYFSEEFYERVKYVNSTNELIGEFENIVAEESIMIKSESIVALKHVSTGNYLSSINDLRYTTGSTSQLTFAGSPVPNPNSLWKIKFDKELASYADTPIKLQHVKSNKFLGIYYYEYDNNGRYVDDYHLSPSTNHTEVSCNNPKDDKYWFEDWKLYHSKLEQGYLMSNDIINLSVKKSTQSSLVEFLRSRDVQFTIGDDTFQEVICHNERLGNDDDWCIELIKQHVWTVDM
ncbi:hypothetical protein RhiirA5_469051 [Rhizophagus irregularis]|uniref:MIR domain-containing protein n=3 Tax=Rhizophagus irregularis TaxID=588596 RepID=U9UBK6_RHIID|nr:hypothetical protein GLOIN_2v1473581 [Rhizophagus irregularis DAOM 181602=DAOM 197198]EXX53561.1 hypothetical protein RirG_242800 [Rhizophagus irregularis DAOM 197198w]PKC11030.1 hypothetical protein RhiirA5_469051 [Rhizophagus irregularis]POG77800.1 hypothetical protein GLOIN_2v1473581 [Rhizophagus irregularis DAOM 181602=DAOM 197198]UZO21264.1 hypothetical protein OCT59_013662 [Rhizophagus irregularis]GBC45794.1 hypothetical protein GLOIN_2v1473581 [Rhizophagus irregularis DAOM 181602=DAO|eukprot:XP_025184666.1 hypothetical protein GLOIN_2v1473581 [Rhizophagus irregularis DAOM 181602=DAOM 197198]